MQVVIGVPRLRPAAGPPRAPACAFACRKIRACWAASHLGFCMRKPVLHTELDLDRGCYDVAG